MLGRASFALSSYAPLKLPPRVWWCHVPIVAKYGLGLVASAAGLTHLHPNTIGTVGPPLAVAGYFLWRRRQRQQYRSVLAFAQTGRSFRLRPYDELDVNNVLSGIENAYDHFRSQVMPELETRIVDHAVASSGHAAAVLLDQNRQISLHLKDPETFVSLRAPPDTRDRALVTFSVPYFSARTHGKRLGTAQVAMVEEEPEQSGNEQEGEETNKVVYRMAVQLWPYKFFSRPERVP